MEQNNFINIFKYNILGGLIIGIASTLYLIDLDSSILCAFAIFFMLHVNLSRSYNDYNILICNPIVVKKKDYIITVLFISISNIIGLLLIWIMIRFTNLYESINQSAIVLANAKLENSIIGIFLSAIFAGICIYISVLGYKKISDIGRYISIIIVALLFAVFGLDNCFIDLFSFIISGEFINRPIHIILTFLVVYIGNFIGALIMKSLEKSSTNI